MSVGDPGPYVELDGPNVWVPRTVPYLRAREIAKQAMEYGDRLTYVGAEDAEMLGFTRDCRCDEVCEARYDEDGEPTDDEPCVAPAWHFRFEEPR